MSCLSRTRGPSVYEVGTVVDEGAEVIEESAPPDPAEWSEPDRAAEFVCPSCFHSWTMEVTHDAVMSGKLEVKES